MKFIRSRNMVGNKFWKFYLTKYWFFGTDLSNESLTKVFVIRLGRLFIELEWI